MSSAISPDAGFTTSNVPYSTNSRINALITDYDEKWGGAVGTGVTLSYSFPWANGKEASFGYAGEPPGSISFGFSAHQQTLTRAALQTWSNVANIRFEEVAETSTDVGVLRFGFTGNVQDPYWGVAFFPSARWAEGGDVWVNPKFNQPWDTVSEDATALVHEIGHALGLKHPFEGAVQIPKDLDFLNYTIMSYTPPEGAITFDPETLRWGLLINKPMVYDILAIQYLYGANWSYRTGNDVYTYDPKRGFFDTIWDAGGNDTLDLSNFNTDLVLNLNDGAYSTARVANWNAKDNLGIAYGAVIENAQGGRGNDQITGNGADNVLQGNDGRDTLIGGAGRNLLDGGQGLDVAMFTGLRNDYTSTKNSGNVVVTSRNGSSQDTLSNIERLAFLDGTLAFDTDGIAGQTYRLYQAAFNRKPDAEGLGYWIRQLESGNAFQWATAHFVQSDEFTSLYGHSRMVSNVGYTELLYKNTLGRQSEKAGLDYWVGQLDNGLVTRNYMLEAFSDSLENRSNVASAISDGIWFA